MVKFMLQFMSFLMSLTFPCLNYFHHLYLPLSLLQITLHQSTSSMTMAFISHLLFLLPQQCHHYHPLQLYLNKLPHSPSQISGSSNSSSPHFLSNSPIISQPSFKPIIPTHPMITRAKSGIFKPKTYFTAT